MMIRMVLAMCLLMLSGQTLAQNNPYLQQLILQSRELKLAERQEWLNLLHFKPYPFWPGSRSLADDPAFFNTVDGKTNAASELEATLAAFFSTMAESNTQQNPQCRFVARYFWLNNQLHFNPELMPVQECKRYNNWYKAINPKEVTLVFPAYYINSPASMYGHTLLRIDAKDQDERTRLLAYSVGYTANTNESNGLLFAYWGLTGGYPGIFQIMPYYMKVREYSDMENRDIWEYRLNLNAEEVDRMMRHIWELGPTRFDYYFLDENCSYHLLSLLEVARPGLNLTDEFRWWAIPSDTVRAVAEQPGLVVQTVFRPSNATIILQRLHTMQPVQRELALDLSKGSKQADDPAIRQLTMRQQTEVVELGSDYLSYLQANKGETAERNVLIRKLQLARSTLDVPSAIPEVKTPEVRPEQGHRSLRMGVGGGNRDGIPYQEVSIRPAYHDQNDPGEGYIRGAQIQFFNLRLRHYGDDAGMRIEEFVPIDIYSLSPRSEYFHSLSWKVNVGWERKHLSQDNEPLISRLNGGVGYSWDTPSFDRPLAQTYAFFESTLESTPQYTGHYAWGAGPAAGVMADLTANWHLHVYAKVQRFALGEPHTVSELSVLQRYTLSRQAAIRLEAVRKAEFDLYWTDISLTWQGYF